jgi:hypothetical protein
MTDLAPGTSLVGSVRRSKWLAMYCIFPWNPRLSQASNCRAGASSCSALANPTKSKPSLSASARISAVFFCKLLVDKRSGYLPWLVGIGWQISAILSLASPSLKIKHLDQEKPKNEMPKMRFALLGIPSSGRVGYTGYFYTNAVLKVETSHYWWRYRNERLAVVQRSPFQCRQHR